MANLNPFCALMASSQIIKDEIIASACPLLLPDSYAYIVSRKWFDKWKETDGSEQCIDNRDIIEENNVHVLKSKCSDDKHYVYFDKSTFHDLKVLCGMATNQEPIKRRVVTSSLDPSRPIIELFPIILYFQYIVDRNVKKVYLCKHDEKLLNICTVVKRKLNLSNVSFWLSGKCKKRIDDTQMTVGCSFKDEKYANVIIEECCSSTDVVYSPPNFNFKSSSSSVSNNSMESPRKDFLIKNDENSFRTQNLELKEEAIVEPISIGIQKAYKGLVGLRNLGNTCYMNSALQLVVHVEALREYFFSTDVRTEINYCNPLGANGEIAINFSNLIRRYYRENDYGCVVPYELKNAISKFASQFSGFDQHDSQELLVTLLDGLHEDLNKVRKKPYTQTPDLSNESIFEASRLNWDIFNSRNDSVIIDHFYGQISSEVKCLQCGKFAVTFDSFNVLSVPLPILRECRTSITVTPYKITGTTKVYLYRSYGNTPLINVFHYFLEQTELDCDRYYVKEQCGEELLKLRNFIDELGRIAGPNEKFDLYETDCERSKGLYFLVSQFRETEFNEVLKQISHPFMVCVVPDVSQKYEKVNLYEDFYEATVERIKDFLMEELSFNHEKQVIKGDAPSYQQVVFRHLQSSGLFAPRFYHPELIRNPWRHKATDESHAYVMHISWDPKVASEIFKNSYPYKSSENFGGKFAKWISFNDDDGLCLEKCIRTFLQPETLEGDNSWFCSSCKQHRKAVKRLSLFKMPKNLLIQLKRFTYNEIIKLKINEAVTFPDGELDMTEFVQQSKEEKYIYELSAVINHYGSLGGGHYTAYVKCQDLGWYEFNDSFVTILEGSPVTKAAYILLYSQKT